MNAFRLAGLLLLAIFGACTDPSVAGKIDAPLPKKVDGDVSLGGESTDALDQGPSGDSLADRQKQKVQTKYPLKRFQAEYTTCEPIAVEAFGISGPKMSSSHPASMKELGVCRKNYESCCDIDGLMMAVELMRKRLHKCSQHFSFLERLLALFRGETYKSALALAKERPECHVAALSSLEAEKAKSFFEEPSIKENIKKIKGLLEDYPTYMDNWNTLYGNILCAVCSPSESRFFAMGTCKGDDSCMDVEKLLPFHFKLRREGNAQERAKAASQIRTTIFLDDSTALFMLMQREFEYRVIQIMIEFMIPLANLLRCTFNSEDDPDYVVDPIKRKKIAEEQRKIDHCLNSNNLKQCMSFVEFSFVRMEYKRIIFTQAQQLHRIFYLVFIEGHLPENFEESRNAAYLTYLSENFCRIFPGNSVSRLHNVRKARFKVLDDGAKISLSKMNKKLVQIDRLKSGFLAGVFGLALAFGLFLV